MQQTPLTLGESAGSNIESTLEDIDLEPGWANQRHLNLNLEQPVRHRATSHRQRLSHAEHNDNDLRPEIWNTWRAAHETRPLVTPPRGGIEHTWNKSPPPVNGEPGFDCSGLTRAAYQAAGITLPRTAQAQYQAGPPLPPGTPPTPGDLIFFGTPSHVEHVALSLGGTAILHAPTFGQPVQISDYRSFTNTLGAIRPTPPQ
jgi:cell wall-associated NlpC family hydrolase